MGQNSSGLGKTRSKGNNKNTTGSTTPRSLHAGLLRERDQGQLIEDVYEIVEEIGQGGLCKIYKIRKHGDKIGGSSRPELVRGRSWIFHSSKLLRRASLQSFRSIPRSEFSNPPLYFALKAINLGMVKEDKIDQLKNEVEILKTLDHMNIINAYEVFQAKRSRTLMIVMELCTGGDLYARIPYTEQQAGRIIKQLLSAISYMHDRKIIHRDLKFENIVFESKDPDAPIKVIDFGLSKEYGTHHGNILSERVGTLYCMSPETLQGAYDEKADIWSIGVCTYMLLAAGAKPFEGKTPKQLISKILKGAFSYQGVIWSGTSDAAKQFISQLLVLNANERPSASQACGHRWIAESSQHGDSRNFDVDEDFKQLVRQSIIEYADTGPFRKLALNVIAKRSTSDEIFKLRKVFCAFDTLNTGTITLDEFKDALAGFNYDDDEVNRIFRSVDVNNNNVINYTEFLAACLEAQGDLAEYRIAEAFDLLDSDDSGYISRDNLRAILGEHVEEKYIKQLIEEADFDGNGKISYAEFLQIFTIRKQKRVSKIYQWQPDIRNSDKN